MATIPVLLIEEDPAVANQVGDVLRYLEFQVLTARPEDPWPEHFGKDRGPYLVLLGGCGGKTARLEIFSELKSLDPYAPLLLMDAAAVLAENL